MVFNSFFKAVFWFYESLPIIINFLTWNRIKNKWSNHVILFLFYKKNPESFYSKQKCEWPLYSLI